MLRFLPLLALGALALPVPAQTGSSIEAREERAIARKLEGRVPGPPQSCIWQSRSQSSTHAGNVVLFEGRNGTRYLGRFRNGCTAKSYETLITRTSSAQLCSGDIVETTDLTSGVSRGACVYDDFTPYRKAR